jgi:peptidoglycan/LPS O-acetylase OafA/YrhL
VQVGSGYRPEIDGLRAVAVLSVVLYHLEAPGFSGGYSGVDVFFVISGFLIGGQIAEDLEQGRFSLIGFYERRARRILPALFAVLVLVMAAGAVVLTPPDFGQLAGVAGSVIALVPNLRMLQLVGGPSGAATQLSPLAHTWSLGIEEQFYLAFPLLMLAIAKFARGRYAPSLVFLGLVSLLACLVASRDASLEDFYLPWFRAWELLLGAVVAIGPPAPRSPLVRQVLALGGLGLIAIADLLLYRGMPYPSELTLLPCLGAALILVAEVGEGGFAGRVLANPPMRWIGLWSYSIYLIHWPLLILALRWKGAPLDPWERAVILPAGLGLAALSWRLVERPFRRKGSHGGPI